MSALSGIPATAPHAFTDGSGATTPTAVSPNRETPSNAASHSSLGEGKHSSSLLLAEGLAEGRPQP